MEFIKLRKLNEDHERAMPQELLDMTVGDMLDRVGQLDTAGDAEYEIVEDALIAIKDKILGDSYSREEEVDFTSDDTVERDESEDEDDFRKEEKGDFPTFDQATSDGNASSGSSEAEGGMDGFNF